VDPEWIPVPAIHSPFTYPSVKTPENVSCLFDIFEALAKRDEKELIRMVLHPPREGLPNPDMPG